MEISINQAAQMAGVVEKTIRLWVRKNNFKHRKAVNQRVWIDKESFETFIESKLEKTNEDVDEAAKLLRSALKELNSVSDIQAMAERVTEMITRRINKKAKEN